MNLWRRFLCVFMLITVSISWSSGYSNSNSFKVFQEKKIGCSVIIADDEDDIDFVPSEGSLICSSQVFFTLTSTNYFSFPALSIIHPSPTPVELRVLRI